MPQLISDRAARVQLRILEEKGHLKHTKRGRKYIFRPTQARRRAGQSAVQHVVKTFFGGSLEEAVAVHLSNPSVEISVEELRRLEGLIREARKNEN